MTFKNNHAIFSTPCNFVIGAKNARDIPVLELNEIAFIGRSNVGKSTLINKLLNNSKIARTSNTPGRTQQLNFFNLGERLSIVDMPGYGFAQAPKNLKNAWTKLMKKFLIGRKNLTRVFLLVDLRRSIKLIDTEFMSLLDEVAVSYQIVFTKADLVKESEIIDCKKNLEKIFVNHPALMHNFIIVSAKSNIGIENLRQEIVDIIER